ncbi:hypothetical protein NLG97_g1269 [Lecanicillium saksenae]|uniref:Uncharacterized protein n=1 Tax=Lecanicillium saksenae TaxID=468837 RepID=A0ACC1R5M2_9HYPO|nr:hypothetical protein NLG97_g1269 [Lecanicillium saksenae]
MRFDISCTIALVAFALAGPGEISYDYEIEQMNKVNDAFTSLGKAIVDFRRGDSGWPAVLRQSTSVVKVIVSAAVVPTGEKPADPPTEEKQEEAFAVADKLVSTMKSAIQAVVAAKPTVDKVPFGNKAVSTMFRGAIAATKVFSGVLVDNTMPDKLERAKRLASEAMTSLEDGRAAFQ